MSRSRRAARALGLVVLAIALGAVVLAALVVRSGRPPASPPRADAAVVLGAAVWDGRPSPVFAGRLDHAVGLYRQRRVERVFLTGGSRTAEPSEAQVGRAYVTARGVAPSDIRVEDRSLTTWQNLRCLADTLGAARPSLAVVSDPYHVRRAVGMARDLGFDAAPAPAPHSRYRSLRSKVPFLAREVWFTAVDALAEATGQRGGCPQGGTAWS